MTNAQRDLAFALERVYGSDQSLEAGALLDKLEDLGWRLERLADPVVSPEPASTRALTKKRSA